MKNVFRRLTAAVLFLTLLLAAVPAAYADEPGQDITDACTVTAEGFSDTAFLHDGDIDGYRSSGGNAAITLSNTAGIGGLYVLFDLEYGEYTIKNNDTGAAAAVGTHSFLHEYINLKTLFGTLPQSVTLEFTNGSVRLSEIYALSDGTPPDFVQTWNAPLDGKADIVLFATHGDDDQLFFAGLMPLYAKVKGLAFQVVYLTDHRNLTNGRTHEMLNGLWAVGVTAYPVFGEFDDFRIDDLEDTYSEFENLGHSRDDLQAFVVEQVRRFRPQVAIGHDLKGEYGHGMHMVYADLLTNALDLTNDPTAFPESAQKYGVWDIPKLYLHLYEENPIVIDYDTPSDALNGMTPFEVTQKYGYPCHKSQQWTWFTDWLNGYSDEITRASQIETYNPCKFGLYRSLVGADVEKNDFMENIISYAEQARLELEKLEQERLEQERLEQERLEQERLEQERSEQERLEQERLEQERLEKLQQDHDRKMREIYALLTVLVVALLLAVVMLVISARRKRKARTKQHRQKKY